MVYGTSYGAWVERYTLARHPGFLVSRLPEEGRRISKVRRMNMPGSGSLDFSLRSTNTGHFYQISSRYRSILGRSLGLRAFPFLNSFVIASSSSYPDPSSSLNFGTPKAASPRNSRGGIGSSGEGPGVPLDGFETFLAMGVSCVSKKYERPSPPGMNGLPC